jgi:hypothetical protein
MPRIAAVAAIFMFLGCSARASVDLTTPVGANMIMMFGCQQANCTTSCVGPQQPDLSITGYKILLVYQTVIHPQRVWMGTDTNKFYMLGEATTCTFGGEKSSPIQIEGTIPGATIPSVRPSCVCANGICNPPGCD